MDVLMPVSTISGLKLRQRNMLTMRLQVLSRRNAGEIGKNRILLAGL